MRNDARSSIPENRTPVCRVEFEIESKSVDGTRSNKKKKKKKKQKNETIVYKGKIGKGVEEIRV